MTAIGSTRTYSAMVATEKGSDVETSSDSGCSQNSSATARKRRKYCKQVWTTEEDRILKDAVAKFGEKAWSKISPLLPGRVGKQCRDRWFNHLNGAVNKGAWSSKEDQILFHAQQELGNQWAEIARKYLPGRTDLSVKNRYYSTLRRVNRQMEHAKRFGALANTAIAQSAAPHAVPRFQPCPPVASHFGGLSQLSQWSGSLSSSGQSSPVFGPSRPSSGLSFPSQMGMRQTGPSPGVFSTSPMSNSATNPGHLRSMAEEQVETLIALQQEQARIQAQTQAQLELLAYKQHLKSKIENQLLSTTAALAARSSQNPMNVGGMLNMNSLHQGVGMGGMSTNALLSRMPATATQGLLNPSIHSMLPSLQAGLLKPKENSGRWNSKEHQDFLDGIKKYGCENWPAVAKMVGTRTVVQVRTHAQKFFKKISKDELSRFTKKEEVDLTSDEEAHEKICNVVVPDPQTQAQKSSSTPPPKVVSCEERSVGAPKMVLGEFKTSTDSAGVAGLLSLSRSVSS